MIKEPKVLVYDIETTPVLAWVWRCGKQVIRHQQLHQDLNETKVICITYRWMHQNKSKALVFNLKTLDDSKIIEKFDEIIKEADIVIGKNNKKFDDKHINYRRLRHGLPPMPEWLTKSDDLEKQMRKHFNMQSYSLDYFSHVQGLGGKDKMEFQDWIDIVLHKSKEKLQKMVDYGLKDVDDTADLIKLVWPHIKPRFNYATHYGDVRCSHCGSINIKKNGTQVRGKTRYQNYYCNDHGGYAGSRPIAQSGNEGKIGL